MRIHVYDVPLCDYERQRKIHGSIARGGRVCRTKACPNRSSVCECVCVCVCVCVRARSDVRVKEREKEREREGGGGEEGRERHAILYC